MFKMIVGISLMSVVAEMFLSGSSFKKYVRAIIGIFTFLVIVEGVFSLESINIDDTILNEAQRISDLTLSQTEKELIDIYEKNIKEEMVKNKIAVSSVKVRCDGNLTIKRIDIKLEDLTQKEKVISILNEKFGLDESLVYPAGQDSN